jgi:hypothetical protein
MVYRLGTKLDSLISINQTTFIKKRCMHYNFVYVREVVRNLHIRKIPTLFIKLHISKSFDTINWSYLLNIMEYLSFGQ